MRKYRGVFLKNEAEIACLREANRVVSKILDALGEAVKPGVATMFYEELTQKMCDSFGVTPAFKGYMGFPYALCCSVNEVVVHGFPSSRILQEGDIVSFDVGVIYQGFYGDSARTFPVGDVPPRTATLLEVSRQALMDGIAQARPGNMLHHISAAVQKRAEGAGFQVVRRFVGHGVGTKLHEKPEVPNFVSKSWFPLPLKVGMVLAIEPMVTIGSPDVEVLSDNWTAVTRDRSLAAHFEHSIAIMPGGPEILSLSG